MKLGLTAIGKLLAKLGLTPQKPLQRAYQRDPEAYLRHVLAHIPDHPVNRIGELLAWNVASLLPAIAPAA